MWYSIIYTQVMTRVILQPLVATFVLISFTIQDWESHSYFSKILIRKSVDGSNCFYQRNKTGKRVWPNGELYIAETARQSGVE